MRPVSAKQPNPCQSSQHSLPWIVYVHTKMKPNSFRLQVQTVLTAYYEDIKGVQDASCSPKTKVVKRKLVVQEDTLYNAGLGRSS